MKRFSVAQVRERLADALDEAERGFPVIIERRGVRYRLSVEARQRRRSTRRSRIETVDPTIEDGQWRWTWTGRGVRLKGRPRP